MRDLFISYAREDRATARRLAAALEAEGWSVWWDLDIPSGAVFDSQIEEALGAARCVVVLWSEYALESHWVRAEAGEAQRLGKLLPAVIADVRPPLAFRQIQCADLNGWQGDGSDPRLRRLVADIDRLAPRSRPGGFAGRWVADVKYPWGVVCREEFHFHDHGGSVYGTGGFMGRPRGLLEVSTEGDVIDFTIAWQEQTGSQTRSVTNRYRGLLREGIIDFVMQDDRGKPPVLFQARRHEGD